MRPALGHSRRGDLKRFLDFGRLVSDIDEGSEEPAHLFSGPSIGASDELPLFEKNLAGDRLFCLSGFHRSNRGCLGRVESLSCKLLLYRLAAFAEVLDEFFGDTKGFESKAFPFDGDSELLQLLREFRPVDGSCGHFCLEEREATHRSWFSIRPYPDVHDEGVGVKLGVERPGRGVFEERNDQARFFEARALLAGPHECGVLFKVSKRRLNGCGVGVLKGGTGFGVGLRPKNGDRLWS